MLSCSSLTFISLLITAVRTKPPAETELGGAPAAKKSKRGKRDEYEKKFIQSKSSVLTGDSEGATERLYKPKTPETKQTYEVLLSFIQVSFVKFGFLNQLFGLFAGTYIKPFNTKEKKNMIADTIN